MATHNGIGFNIYDTLGTKASHTRDLPLMDWAAIYRNKDTRDTQASKGVEACTWWCRLGYAHLSGPGVIADTDENARLMRMEALRGQSSNGFDQIDATRAAGRARQRAGMLALFADKR